MKRYGLLFLMLLIVVVMPMSVCASTTNYVDGDTGVAFTIPEDWYQDTTYVPQKFTDSMFYPKENRIAGVAFGSYDAWNGLAAAERKQYSRADVNMSMFSKEDISDIFGVDSGHVEKVDFPNASYFKVELVQQREVENVKVDFHQTTLMNIQNGWYYSFVFTEAEGNTYYSDFEKLVSSVQYPVVQNTDDLDSPSGFVSADEAGHRFNAGSFVFGLIYTLLIYYLPVAVYRHCIRRYPMTVKQAKQTATVHLILAWISSMCIHIFIFQDAVAPNFLFIWWFVNYKVLTRVTSKDVKKIDPQGFSTRMRYTEAEQRAILSTVPYAIAEQCKTMRCRRRLLTNYLNEQLGERNIKDKQATVLYQEHMKAERSAMTRELFAPPLPVAPTELVSSEESIPQVNAVVADVLATEEIDSVRKEHFAVAEQPIMLADTHPVQERENCAEKPVFCRKCGETIPSGNRFCHKCGTDTEEQPSIICYCRRCGEILTEDSVFCGKCGTKVVAE